MKKDENLGSWILMIDAICQRQTNHLQTFGRQCRKIICHWIFTKQKTHLLALWPVTIALGLSCLQNERWLPSILQNRISNILFHVICWFRRAWTCKTYWTTANYKSIRFIVIYCVLISTNVQFSDQNALHDSNQVLPCNRFFLFSARSDCPSPENFWLSIFHPPDIFISGKRPKTWFQWGAFYWFWTADWL